MCNASVADDGAVGNLVFVEVVSAGLRFVSASREGRKFPGVELNTLIAVTFMDT